jgi:ABC-2 type transport system permease protein
MAGLNRIWILINKEFTEFYSSKAWIIVLILPLFIAFLFATVYHQAKVENYRIAYLPPARAELMAILTKSGLQPVAYPQLAVAKTALAENKVDAVMLPRSATSNRVKLLVSQAGYRKAVAVGNALNVALIQIYANPKLPQFEITGPRPIASLDWIALPLWLIQIILTICLLQNTSQIADEKERQTLHSLLVSPMTLTDYLTAKLSWSVILGTAALMMTLFLTKSPAQPLYILIFGICGTLVYSSLAILLGLLAPNALFARTTATVVYLASSLPLMLSNSDLAWKGLLNNFPTFLILRGFEAALLPTTTLGQLSHFGVLLLGQAAILLGVAYLILKKKVDF